MESYPKFHNEVGVSCDIEVDVWVILRRFIPNALELAAANAHDRDRDFIMKLRVTFHLQRAAYAPER